MHYDPTLRAGDADRENVVAQLREHYAAGRLDVDEFEQRSDQAYQARTFGDLSALTTDLPAAPLVPATPSAPVEPVGGVAAPANRRRNELAAWSSWFSTGLVLTAIWLISVLSSGHLSYFWPAWVIGPMAAVFLARTITGSHHSSGGHQQHRDHPSDD